MGLIKIDENSGWMIEEMKCFFLLSNSSLQTEIYSFKGLDKVIKHTFYSIENYHQVEGEITLTDDEWKVIAKLIQKKYGKKIHFTKNEYCGQLFKIFKCNLVKR